MSNLENNVQNEINDDAEKSDSNKPKNINLLNVEINNEVTALNTLIGFVNIAQRRGVYAINESAKIYECVNFFIKK